MCDTLYNVCVRCDTLYNVCVGDRVCMAGAGLATVGLVSASLVTTIPQLLLCYSVITGLGFGLM